MEYFDIYKKRLNRYGLDYQSRIPGQREHLFDLYLLKSVYRVEFDYKGQEIVGSLERYKQDETQTLQYLLVPIDVTFPVGTILNIDSGQNKEIPWMVYWLEEIKASGYNRYVVLRMTHTIKWKYNNEDRENLVYLFGGENASLKDEIQSRSGAFTLYSENQNLFSLIFPVDSDIKRDTYIKIDNSYTLESFVVTGYDTQSTPGVMYASLDPVPIRNETPIEKTEDSFWLRGE